MTSKQETPTDSRKQPHRRAAVDEEELDSAPVEIYYADNPPGTVDGPDKSEMYTYTPSASDLLTEYTRVGTTEAQNITQVFQEWGSDGLDSPRIPDDVTRPMGVGDVIVFDDVTYLIRPSGYDVVSTVTA